MMKSMKAALLAATTLAVSTAAVAQADGFASAMDAAMTRMHAAMTTGQSGDPDRDFATMMIPHHQGAIDMAEIELRYGKDERLRRLAQGIIVEQRQEIAVMQGILADRPQPAKPSSSSSSTSSIPADRTAIHEDHR